MVFQVRPHNGRSALHLASFRGHLDVVKHLVDDGYANKYLLDNNGESPLTSAVRGCRPTVLAHLLSDIDPTSQADQALCTNDNDEATLLLAERDNLSLFSHCQRTNTTNNTTHTTTNNEVNDTALDALDRSNQIIQLLLNALSKAQSSAFEHVHECFAKGMNAAAWYEENGTEQ